MRGARLATDADAFSAAGMRVAGVIPGGMADAAGLAAGDLVVAIAGGPVRSMAELAAAMRRAGARVHVEIQTERASSTVAVQHAPREEAAEYGVLEVPGARLRTIVTGPADGPAVLVLQGIACESIEHGAFPELVHGWARGGVRAIRVDRRGVGDSEGGPCGDLDFATDLADHAAALAALPRSRVLFGHSVGGMAAALLAAEHAVDGVIVYGTSTATWLDCVAASTRRQLEQRGVAADAIERQVAGVRARFLGEGASGRSGAYHRQLDALDLPAAWARVAAPVLVLHGEHDWVVGRDEQARIVEIVGGRGALVDLPGLDHLLGWHPDRESSLAAYGAGRWDPAIVAVTRDWLLRSDA
jgi:pimeloyl-ACP methyl ester carboxylesterase